MEAFPIEASAVEPDLEHDPALGLSQRRKFEILGAILLGLFLGALDQTVVGTALPRIVTDLGGNELYTWVVTIYLLTSTITVPFYGKLSDLFGRKPFLLGGITLFLVGSALSGLSQNMAELIIFRGIQGVGAGALFPISLAVIGDLFTPAERGKYQGLFGAVFGISFIVGPALGGFLTDNISWHWVFYVNIPIGLISLFVISRLLPNVKNPNATRSLDYLGGLIFTIAIGFLLVGLTNKQTGDWFDPTVGGFIAIAVVLLAAFLVVESRAKEPIVPLDLWRGRVYSASMISTFFVSFAFFGAIIFLPRWFQSVRHESATNSGYLLFPLLIGLIGSSIVSGFLVARSGRYKAVIVVGLALTAVGLALMTQLQATTDYVPLWAWMFITGVGIGPTLAVFTIAVQNAVPFSKLGVATSNLTFFRQIGGSVGLAISGTVFATQLTNDLPSRLAPVRDQLIGSVPEQFRAQAEAGFSALASGGGGQNLQDFTGVGQSFGQAILQAAPPQFQSLIAPFVPQFDAAFHQAFTSGLVATFAFGVVATLVAFVAALALKEVPLRRTLGPEPAAANGPGPAVAAGEAAVTPSAPAPSAPAPVASSRPAAEPPTTGADAPVPRAARPAPSPGSLAEPGGAAFVAAERSDAYVDRTGNGSTRISSA
ncbi:MAG TPA: DHA2 family efflux MFS transporter permease subunit, partial [Candidatus Limnocylindrales bacterium]|nr:DHA2 family efflux MFS transporter permease subunit [Candidatus Limnocylindrales bacterium]